ncbi:MAG TPA: hypothetical protein VGQ67_03745 [Candidatus Polarisedimenticolia bacterium]|jgi:uncharacterized small protein (DUF1192 family)|nr:hypothetical protein [Candidatus Polarisedimenticolia bacterium]
MAAGTTTVVVALTFTVILMERAWAQGTPGQAPSGAGTMLRPSDEALKGVTELGRKIASYHEGIERCRAALKAQRADLEDARAVMVDRNGVLHVVFMRPETGPNETRPLMMVADAVFQPKAGEVVSLQVIDPSKAAPVDAAAFLRALESARAGATTSAHLTPPYIEAAFKEKPNGAYTVYVQSKPEGARMARFGADVLVRVGADGSALAEVRSLHDATVNIQVPAKGGTEPTLHSHGTGDLPTETDIATVLEHPTLAPHLVLTPRYMFRIESDGSITYIGPNSVPPVPAGGAH